MRKVLYFLLALSFFSCKEDKEDSEQKRVTDIVTVSPKIKRSIDFITDSIANSIKYNPTKEIDSFVRSKKIFKSFKLSNPINDWTFHTEYYQNGKIKEKGLYLNGWSFGKWFEYDENGEVTSEIDYTNAEIIKGKKINYESMFLKFKSKSDSLLIQRFGSAFFKEHIRLNLDRTWWYTNSNSGSILERGKTRPVEYLLRYSIIINDTIVITPIEISFDKDTNYMMEIKNGVPDESIDFRIDYLSAKKIANENGFGLKTHNNEFSKHEYLDFYYIQELQTYFWSISDVPETSYSDTENGEIIKGIGKSLYINSKTGEIHIDDFPMQIIYD